MEKHFQLRGGTVFWLSARSLTTDYDDGDDPAVVVVGVVVVVVVVAGDGGGVRVSNAVVTAAAAIGDVDVEEEKQEMMLRKWMRPKSLWRVMKMETKKCRTKQHDSTNNCCYYLSQIAPRMNAIYLSAKVTSDCAKSK